MRSRTVTDSVDEDTWKTYRTGTHRLASPEETLARVKPLLPVFGITRIANVTGLDCTGIPVVMVARPNSRSVAVAQGKGIDLPSAKASGVMEAIETWHAETIQLPLKYGSFEELHWHHRMIDVASMPMPADTAYDHDRPLLWIEGVDIMNGGELWLPYESVHANYTWPLPPGSGCFAANTNGLASGNHRLEAILHGLCEVIERDATTLWMLASDDARAARLLRPETIDDPLCQRVMGRFEAAGIELRLWDITTDVNVPAYLCLAANRSGSDADPEFGSGCHPAPPIALLRALTEAAQARTTYITGARDDIGAELYAAETRAERLQACIRLLEHHPTRHFTDTTGWQADTIAWDLKMVLRHLAAVGITQVATVDLSKPAFRIPVVRVVVPGLEGPWEDHGDGSLPGSRALAVIGPTR